MHDQTKISIKCFKAFKIKMSIKYFKFFIINYLQVTMVSHHCFLVVDVKKKKNQNNMIESIIIHFVFNHI